MINFGIIGTGLIATDVAKVLVRSHKVNLKAISSRTLLKAHAFAQQFSAEKHNTAIEAVEGLEALLGADVDVVYLAIPTAFKYEAGLRVLNANKHLLIDKPMPSEKEASELVKLAKQKNLLIMDATHFVHHPRTQKIKHAIQQRLGEVNTLHSSFYFPVTDVENIRFQTDQEPMTGIGDLGWYNMRAIVEFLQPQGEVDRVSIVTEKHHETAAVIRASGLISFADGKSSTFQMGYNANAVQMDLSIVGSEGIIHVEDFVLDWHDSHVFHHPEITVGYTCRQGLQTKHDFQWIAEQEANCAHQLMVEKLAELIERPDVQEWDYYAQKLLITQRYVDCLWRVLIST